VNEDIAPQVHSRKALDDLTGWLLADKPSGMSSNDALMRIRRGRRKLKVGHAGTLDPSATGLLLVAVGATTRLVEATHRLDKTYEARVRLGATSPTDDADGPWTETPDAVETSLEAIRSAVTPLMGDSVLQIPPAYSALHVDGQRAYDLARRGTEVVLAPRPVRIKRISILHFEWPFLDIEVDCGAGTYIRSIARDLGASLGVGGMIETLRRTRIGAFDVARAHPLDELEIARDLTPFLEPPVMALTEWPKLVIDDAQLAKTAKGQSFLVDFAIDSSEIALIDETGRLMALARLEPAANGLVCKPYRVFAAST
jgi:tRNA pseudouridine55 synthase